MFALSDLPFLNACLNTVSSIFLVTGRIAIAYQKEDLHRRVMLVAFTTSILFLTSYLYYHFNTELVTVYQGMGVKRILYYLMLISHVVLAAVTAPAIIYLLILALRGNFARHRKLATYLWPLWLYVSVTGVSIYYVLYM